MWDRHDMFDDLVPGPWAHRHPQHARRSDMYTSPGGIKLIVITVCFGIRGTRTFTIFSLSATLHPVHPLLRTRSIDHPRENHGLVHLRYSLSASTLVVDPIQIPFSENNFSNVLWMQNATCKCLSCHFPLWFSLTK